MKQLEVRRIGDQQVNAADIPALFRVEKVTYQKIDTVDWAADYPYCPQVEFALAHKLSLIPIRRRRR